MSVGPHEEERILQVTSVCPFPYVGTQQADDEAHEPWRPAFLAEFGIRRTGDRDELPAALEHAEGFCERRAVLAVEDNVVIVQHVLKILHLVIDDDVRAQTFHERDVSRARRRGDGCTQMLGQLDGESAYAAGTRLYEDL